MQIHLKEKTWNWHARTITLLELWSSDLMCRLEIQSWCSDLKFRLDVQTWESSIQDWRLKILQGLFLENLQSRIEDWRLKILQDSCRGRLKILQDSCWGIFNPGLKIEDWKFPRTLLGESSVQDWEFNIKGSLLDWRFSKKSPGESSIFNPGLKILQEESWRIFNLQSWIAANPWEGSGDAWRWGDATGWGHWGKPGSWVKVASAPKAWDWNLSVLLNLHSEAIHASWRTKKVCSSEGMWVASTVCQLIN